MGTSTQLLTFAEFERLPDPREGKYELRHGEVVLMPPPKLPHSQLQHTLQSLLAAANPDWVAVVEMGFRPASERDFRIADIAVTRRERFYNRDTSYFEGAPELVIEVLSPSNTVSEMRDRCDICLRNGAREFWLVDPERKTVEVSTPDGHTIRYELGQSVPLWFGGSLGVAAVFA